jgi:hypothetical protein
MLRKKDAFSKFLLEGNLFKEFPKTGTKKLRFLG